jgi:hypothetical protein
MMIRSPGAARFGEDGSAGPSGPVFTANDRRTRHEMGNPAGDRPSLRHGNHDVHRASLTGRAARVPLPRRTRRA